MTTTPAPRRRATARTRRVTQVQGASKSVPATRTTSAWIVPRHSGPACPSPGPRNGIACAALVSSSIWAVPDARSAAATRAASVENPTVRRRTMNCSCDDLRAARAAASATTRSGGRPGARTAMTGRRSSGPSRRPVSNAVTPGGRGLDHGRARRHARNELRSGRMSGSVSSIEVDEHSRAGTTGGVSVANMAHLRVVGPPEVSPNPSRGACLEKGSLSRTPLRRSC